MWQVRQLEAFQAVMATGSMTKAASGLHISQPAISKLIATLEEECGFMLFQRRGNRLAPTVEGGLLYSEVQRLLLGTQEIQRMAAEIRGKKVGTLNLAAFPALTTRVLPGIVTRFCAEHPNVRILLTGRSSAFMTNWLSAQRVDLGISVLRENRPGMRCERLLRMEAVCALPAGHPLARYKVLSARQIAEERLVSLSEEDMARAMVERYFQSANVRPKVSVETQLSESACQFVVEGAGVSIVEPLSTLGFTPEQLAIRRIRPRFYFDIWLITPSSRSPSLITTEFINFFSVGLKKILKDAGFHYI